MDNSAYRILSWMRGCLQLQRCRMRMCGVPRAALSHADVWGAEGLRCRMWMCGVPRGCVVACGCVGCRGAAVIAQNFVQLDDDLQP